MDEELARSCFFAYIAFVGPIFLAGLLSSRAPRSPSFSTARPGLRSGFHVKSRLRVVEFCTFLLEVAATLIALITVYVSMPLWIHKVGAVPASEIVFGIVVLFIFLASHWILRSVFLSTASFLFRRLHLMNAQEAKYFPLTGSKRRLEPWPENWQEPQHGSDDAEHERGR
jgi:hypothetical protein